MVLRGLLSNQADNRACTKTTLVYSHNSRRSHHHNEFFFYWGNRPKYGDLKTKVLNIALTQLLVRYETIKIATEPQDTMQVVNNSSHWVFAIIHYINPLFFALFCDIYAFTGNSPLCVKLLLSYSQITFGAFIWVFLSFMDISRVPHGLNAYFVFDWTHNIQLNDVLIVQYR